MALIGLIGLMSQPALFTLEFRGAVYVFAGQDECPVPVRLRTAVSEAPVSAQGR